MKTKSEKSKTQKVIAKKTVPVKKSEIIDGYTIKYHANGKTRWSKGKVVKGKLKDIGNGTAWMAH